MKLYTSYFAEYRGDRGVVKAVVPDWELVVQRKEGLSTWEEFEILVSVLQERGYEVTEL